jgi:hypothetical protein
VSTDLVKGFCLGYLTAFVLWVGTEVTRLMVAYYQRKLDEAEFWEPPNA